MTTVLRVALSVAALVCCVNPGQALEATCVIDSPQVAGIIRLSQQFGEGSVILRGEINGLAEGLHGFHIHEYGDLSNGCTSAGGHYNPTNQDHSSQNNRFRHVGDLGNIQADRQGVAHINITDHMISLCSGFQVVGRAIVVHEKEDDLGIGGDEGSLKTGNAGGRLGCCVIGYASSP